jgi:hypothetical protein
MLKLLKTKDKDKIVMAIKMGKSIYRRTKIRIIADYSSETMQGRET